MESNPKIDIHIHLAGTGCNCSGCWINPKLRRRYTIKALQILHKISSYQMQNTIDEDWGKRVSNLVNDSHVDYGVVLGFDGAFDPSTGKIDMSNSQMIIPPSWVFKLCETYNNLLPGPSINPHAQDALSKLEYCIEKKAVLIKWLPSAQLIDPASPNLAQFYEKIASSGIPLLIHCGGEKTFASLNPSLNDVDRLTYPLEAGVKIICAHSATKIIGSSEEDQSKTLDHLLEKYENLWVDNSGICNPSRFSHLPKLTQNPIIVDRTLYGSDWPVPSNSFYYIKKLGLKEVIQLEKIRNWIDRDIEIKRRHGYPDITLTRANQVLANLDYWIK
ncbi:MAG: amidohydrolase family protein [Bdellovibrionota bacterium]